MQLLISLSRVSRAGAVPLPAARLCGPKGVSSTRVQRRFFCREPRWDQGLADGVRTRAGR
jgi:hypothetical protein